MLWWINLDFISKTVTFCFGPRVSVNVIQIYRGSTHHFVSLFSPFSPSEDAAFVVSQKSEVETLLLLPITSNPITRFILIMLIILVL